VLHSIILKAVFSKVSEFLGDKQYYRERKQKIRCKTSLSNTANWQRGSILQDGIINEKHENFVYLPHELYKPPKKKKK
jgi:hypothetical protein